MNQLDFAAINQALDPETVLPQWLPAGHRRGKEWVSPNPTRNDRNPGSFTINMVSGVWKDYATGEGGSDLVSLYAYLFHHNDQGAAAKELAGNFGVRIGDPATRQAAHEAAKVRSIEEAKPEPIFPVPITATAPKFSHPRYGEPTARWEYRDRNNRTILWVCRFDPEGERKQIIPLSWCKHPPKDDRPAQERWTWRGITGSKKRPLFGLDRLAADPEADAIMVEGEKATEAGQRLFGQSAIVTSWLGGVETADRVNINALAGRRVVLWPDFDALTDKATGELLPLHEQPGVRAMMALAQALKGVAREVLLVGYQMDATRHGWDLADAEADGWTTEQAAAYMAKNAGDPWHIASAKPAAPTPARQEPAGGDQPPAAPPSKPPANDNFLPLDASVNPFGFPHMGEKGQPLNTVENLAYLLGEYGISVRYNITRKLVEVVIPGRDYGDDLNANCTLAEISSLCSRNKMPKADAENYIKLMSSWDRYNPIQEFIQSRPWDGVSRLADLFGTLHTAPDYDRTLLEMLVRRWLVSAVAAALKPRGFWSKGVLVLQGGQSEGKTSWFKALLSDDLRKLLKVGATIDPANKDSVSSVISHWMVELGELDATFRKADIARLKSFISQDIDQLRRPYDRLESEYQRRTVFFASVNPKNYLVDETGNVRWWTIPVTSVDPEHGIDMQQLWAEVAHLYEQGERWWLTKDEEALLAVVNQDHQTTNSIKELIQARFDWSGLRDKLMSATEVLVAIGYDKPTNPQAKDAGQALRELTGEEPRKSNGRMVFKMPGMFRSEQRQMFNHHDEDRPF